jgi:thiamine biosynthesis lipoprotein
VFQKFNTILALAILTSGCIAASPIHQEGSIDAMGSLISVTVYGDTAAQANAAVSDALDEAGRLDAMLSNYKPHSEWSEMNREAAGRPVRVSKELFDLLTQCLEYSRASEGTFDISVGPLMKVWGFYKGTGHLASRHELATAMQSVGYQNIILDRASLSVRFTKPGVELDPGGIGKGYAVDRMIDVLRRDGIRSALVSAAGSSIYALGAPPNQQGWALKLKDPRHSAASVATVCLRDESLSTSGSYEKFFVADGKLWSHIMDPRTGSPAPGMLSVSVIAPNTIDSEAWAKPFFILGRAWAKQHKKFAFRIFMCEDRPATPCTWI